MFMRTWGPVIDEEFGDCASDEIFRNIMKFSYVRLLHDACHYLRLPTVFRLIAEMRAAGLLDLRLLFRSGIPTLDLDYVFPMLSRLGSVVTDASVANLQ